MKLNTKIRYGLRTMIEISMNAGTTGLLQKDIAERQEIPLKYLDKIISELKSAGLIVNVAGKRSGYVLGNSSGNISVYDIYKAFEGKLSIINCVDDNSYCCRSETCSSREFWDYLNTEMEAIMLGKSLNQLAKRQQVLNTAGKKLVDFQI